MGRLHNRSSHDETNTELKKGPWTPEEDQKLVDGIKKHGKGSWQLLPLKAGLNRCGKSCRLRWTNYLRPDIKRGEFSLEEERLIVELHSILGNKWSTIATRLPGRTDNEIKNFWNTNLRKKLIQSGIDPVTHQPLTNHHPYNFLANLMLPNSNLIMNNPLENLTKIQLLQNIMQILSTNPSLASLGNSIQNVPQFDNELFLSTVPDMENNFNPTFFNEYKPIFDGFQTIQALVPNSNINLEYSLPELVPATHEISTLNQVHKFNHSSDIQECNKLLETCSSINEGSLGAVMDNEADYSSIWKDMLIGSSDNF